MRESLLSQTSPHPRHPELVSGSIGRFAPIGFSSYLLEGCFPNPAPVKASKWTLKQVQGDDVLGRFL